MFTIEFDRQHSLTLARFSGEFGFDDIGTLDRVGEIFVAAEGPSHFLFEFSAVEAVSMPPWAIARRGRRPQLCPGYQRIVVAPQPEILELYRVFGANQLLVGSAAPMLVKTMAQALAHIGVPKPRFKPVPTSWIVPSTE
jgi:hypothetical protein